MSYFFTNYLTDEASYFDFILLCIPAVAETSRSRYPGGKKMLSLLIITLVIQFENVSEASSKCVFIFCRSFQGLFS